MMIDCDTCAVRGLACGDCVVTVLLGAPPAIRPGDQETGIDLDGREQAAIAVLAGSGLIPPLRLVPAAPSGGERGHPEHREEWICGGATGPGDEHPDGGRRAAV
jgi:hypothetical protein